MNLEELIKLQEQLNPQHWENMTKKEREEQTLKEFKSHLQYVDLPKLQKKIDRFRRLNFKSLSYTEVGKAIQDVVLFDTPFGKRSLWGVPSFPPFPIGTRFYRVRTIPSCDRQLPLKSMSTIHDCWEPPKEIVDIGRLNRAKESLLYTTPVNPFIVIEERKIPEKEFFSLIVYEAIEQINVVPIGIRCAYKGLNESEILKLRMFEDFLCHEFIRDVGKGTEYLYRNSEYIAKRFFDLPPEVQDAWCYPSIVKKENYNVCFRPNKRKEKLKLIGVQIASVCKINNQKTIQCS